jgi:hypothetical protein
MAFGILAIFALAGCGGSIHGDWSLAACKPNRETFSIDKAHFERGGEYAAMISLDGRTMDEKGQYEFNGFKITFRPASGGSRTYNCVRKWGELEIRDGERMALLKKN